MATHAHVDVPQHLIGKQIRISHANRRQERARAAGPKADEFLEQQKELRAVPLHMQKEQFLSLAVEFVKAESEVPTTELRALNELLRRKLRYSYQGVPKKDRYDVSAALKAEPRLNIVWTSHNTPSLVSLAEPGVLHMQAVVPEADQDMRTQRSAREVVRRRGNSFGAESLGLAHVDGDSIANANLAVIAAHDGIPDITVLFTSKESEAAEFIKGWAGINHFGLDLEWKPSFQKGQYSRAATLQICAGPWVLVFDLKAHRTKDAKPLPDTLWHFLENEQHTFYGMGLLEDLTRLAFEFDCTVSGVDFTQAKAWLRLGKSRGGLVCLANRVLGTIVHQSKKLTMSNWDARPLSQQQLQYITEDAYLSWGLANHFIKAGFPHEDYLVAMSDMYGRGRKHIGNCAAGIIDISCSCHDWEAAKAEYESNQADKKAKKAYKQMMLAAAASGLSRK